MNPAVEACEIGKSYHNGVKALCGLTLSIAPGTVFALIGPNGAGKSTTVKILTTLARPDSGTATVAGYDVWRQPGQVRRHIGYVAQQNISDPFATGRENLLFHGHLHGLRGKGLNSRIADLLERFELGIAANRMVYEYSGGMRRRLDVAMGFIHEPAVLFLDEPTTGLDPSMRAFMWAEISRMCREAGATVLLTSHYLEEVERAADRLAIITRGTVLTEGTPSSLKTALGGGDVVLADLAQPVSACHAERITQRVPEILQAEAAGYRMRLRAINGGAAVPSILDALRALNLKVRSITVTSPTLDDVYLHSHASPDTEQTAPHTKYNQVTDGYADSLSAH